MTLGDFTIDRPNSKYRPSRPSTIERAFELARSGECGSLVEIEKRLLSENHDNVVDHLAGAFTRDQLRTILARNVARPRPVPAR